MKSSRRSKRKLEDCYDFDSLQVGWNKDSVTTSAKKPESKQPVKDLGNTSFDWSRSCEGFSGLAFDSSTKNKPKAQSSKKPKFVPSYTIASSSDEEEQVIDDDEISWNSSESGEDGQERDGGQVTVITNKKWGKSGRQTKTLNRKSGQDFDNLRKKTSIKDEDNIDNLSSDSDVETRNVNCQKRLSCQLEARVSPHISSCPSSQSTSPGTSGLKGSDWMKLMDWQTSPEKQNYQEEQPDPDSAKKTRKKYLRGGLAESLYRIQTREKSCLRIWQHQSQTNTQQTTTKVLRLRVVKFELFYSMQLADCTLTNTEGGEAKSRKVLFTKQLMESLKIKEGTEVEVHAPWQELNCVSSNTSIILCTNYVKVLSQTNHSRQPSPFKSVRNTYSSWSCPCLHDNRVSSKECPANNSTTLIEKQPAENIQIVPTSSMECSTTTEKTIHIVTASQLPALSNQKSPTLRQCLENHTDQSLSFIAQISRVFHWYDTRLKESRCSLMVEDCGTMAVIYLSDDRNLTDLDKHAGSLSWFTGLKVQQRVTRDRDAKLFSVIDVAWSGHSYQATSQESQSQTLFNEGTEPPGFCYILSTHEEDIFEFNIAENTQLTKLPEITKISLSHLKKCESICRFTCYCKILHITSHNQMTRELYISDMSIVSNNIPYKVIQLLPSNHLYPITTTPGPIVCCTDLRLENGQLAADEFTRITMEITDNINLNTLNIKLPRLTSDTTFKSLVSVQGIIDDIDEDSACSWEECDICGSDQLTTISDDSPAYCSKCKQSVITPVIRLEMEVSVKMEDLPDSTSVKINLLESTIKSLLPSETSDEGYDINQVIGKSLPLISCLVKSTTCKDSHTEFILQQIDV
ncbi:DNA repair-scaffolding protein [Patella vulgata]|uniref:DNA repair-scaffolding protein n=1 Tax=Patella vulgata TaxID=6465 RepID=UPI00217FEA9B|nr:DNA repair-scaffolding protein [Patella vulgata]